MSTKEPFFSIIIPTFNRADLLPKAISSVLSQTFDDWELIIVDDGSTDNTEAVVCKIEDPRIRYIYQSNAERSAARNNGIEHAHGSYICFLDSDDYYTNERLELLHQEITKRNCPIAMFYTDILTDRSGKFEKLHFDYGKYENIYENILRNTIGNPQVSISRDILSEFKFDIRFHIGEDVELWLRVAQKYPLIYIENQYTFVVVEHEDRSVNVMRYNSGVEQLRLYRYIFDNNHSGKNLTSELKSFLVSRAFQSIAKYNIHQHNRIAAIVALIKAIKSDRHSVLLKFRINILIKLMSFYPFEKLKMLLYY